jgi:hypothetical protein
MSSYVYIRLVLLTPHAGKIQCSHCVSAVFPTVSKISLKVYLVNISAISWWIYIKIIWAESYHSGLRSHTVVAKYLYLFVPWSTHYYQNSAILPVSLQTGVLSHRSHGAWVPNICSKHVSISSDEYNPRYKLNFILGSVSLFLSN